MSLDVHQTAAAAASPMNESAPTPAGPTYDVLLSRRLDVQAALEQLAKRGARRGLPALTWSWGKPYSQRERVSETSVRNVERIPLTFTCSTPKLAGWTFLAALEHLGEENITRTVPGAELPTEYRNAGPVCQHCRTNRPRSNTYVLRHDSGALKQVGSTCVQDFLGSADAEKIAAWATLLFSACALADDDNLLGGGGGFIRETLLTNYLPIVAAVVRASGWVSRTAAREKDCRATADVAWEILTDAKAAREAEKDGIVVTEADTTLATAAAEWAENLSDETINAEKGDYLHNLRAVARTGVVNTRGAGIAASMVTAYERFLGRERAKKERAAIKQDIHVGVVGERTVFDAKLDFVTGYEGAYGYTTVLKFLIVSGEQAGATIVWKASGNPELGRADIGKRYWVLGTVKKHDEYKGAKQTVLSRCVVTENDGSTPPPNAPKPKSSKPSKKALAKAAAEAAQAREKAAFNKAYWLAVDARQARFPELTPDNAIEAEQFQKSVRDAEFERLMKEGA